MYRSVARALLDELYEGGVRVVFGIPGGAAAPFFEALLTSKLTYINASHECGAMFMAVGYTRSTGRPAAVLTTAGPGVANAMTGVLTAHYENAPVILISGEVSTSSYGKGAVQESGNRFDSVQILRPVTRYAGRVLRADAAVSMCRLAISSTLEGRMGPSHLSLPFDIGFQKVKETSLVTGTSETRFTIKNSDLERSAQALLEAKRPLLIAGVDCLSSPFALGQFAQHFGIPVATTPRGKGVFSEDHPLALGVIGLGGHPSVYDYVNEGVDVLFSLGANLDDLATNAWSQDLQAPTFIQVDEDAARIGRSYKVDIGIVGRVSNVCEALVQYECPHRAVTHESRYTFEASRDDNRLDGPLVAALVNKHTPTDSLYTADMGEHLVSALHHLEITQKRAWFTALGFGSMGSGPCSAVGAQMGAPSRPVFSLVGDGGFMMLNELSTAVIQKLPLTFVVFNDGCLNMPRHGMLQLIGNTQNFTTGNVDFAQLANAIGAEGAVVHTPKELIDALARSHPETPLVIDARIDPEGRVPSVRNRTHALASTLQGAN